MGKNETPEHRRERQKKSYWAKKERHACYKCGAPTGGIYIACADCREKDRERSNRNNAIYRAKLAEEGRCTRCATYLIDEDEGYKTCLNCRLHDHEGRAYS